MTSDGMTPDFKLSNNFTLRELCHSDYAVKHGIQNIPATNEKLHLKELCVNVLQRARDHFGKPIRVNSGFRSPELNRAINGSKTSDHMRGMAADIEIADGSVSCYDLANWIATNCDFKQVILEFPDKQKGGSWVHVSFDLFNNKKEILTAFSQGRTVYQQGLIV